jgi:26S proteasome regulatory subunit T5
MSSVPPPNPDPTPSSLNEKQPEGAPPSSAEGAQDAPTDMDTAPDQPAEDTFADIPEDVMALTTDEIITRTRMIDNDIKVGRF